MALIVMGLMVAMAAFISSIVQAGSDSSASSIAAQAAWTFGIATAALGTIKTGIAFILWGIVRRLWLRVESVKAALPDLMPSDRETGDVSEGPISTPYGAGTITRTAPAPLPIHRMALKLWAPMLVMGVMLVMIGVILSIVEAAAADSTDPGTFQTLRALVPGIEFFGEALLLAGISFLLASILASLRQGGGEVQESVGAGVKTLLMPLTAKLFLALMVMGMMVSMLQLVLYIVVATLDSATAAELQTINAWHAWLGPLREAGLGLLLSGIVLALVTIGTVLGFQFHRIRELIATGR
jgi:hypothetical protein